jgi:hypothetical protein
MASKQGEDIKDSTSGTSEADSEVKLWGPVIALLIAILVIPIGWLGFVRLLGGSIDLKGDASGFLATIGGVMGAIFTVGGLVIAIVAILTQISLQDRIRRVLQNARKEFEGTTQNAKKSFEEATQHSVKEIEKKYDDDLRPEIIKLATAMIEEKYQNDLRPDVEKRVNQQIRGHMLLLDAEEAMKAFNWAKAEEITREALKLYPKVPGARSRLGLWMSEAVMYTIEQEHRITNVFSWVARMEQQFQKAASPSLLPHVSKAIVWLEEAVKNDDDLGEQCSAALTIMFGVRDGFQKMIDGIKTLKDNRQALDWLYQPDYLTILLDGCKSAPEEHRARKDMLDSLNYPLPDLDQVRNSFLPNENVFWLVTGQPKYWARYSGPDKLPNFPTVVTITGGGKTEEGGNPGRIFYPFWHRQSETLPSDKLIDELNEKFIPICQAPYGWIISRSPFANMPVRGTR